MGLLLVLSAPSGAGKTTLAHRLLAAVPEATFSVSYTTRAPRGAEKEGVDYHFVDSEAFRAMVDRGEFLEWAEVFGCWYGSHRRYADLAIAEKIVVFDIDTQGGNTIKGKVSDAALVYIVPPGLGELERRLRERKTDSEDTIRRRLMSARNEIDRGIATYDYVIVNDDLERAQADLLAIVRSERLRRSRFRPAAVGL